MTSRYASVLNEVVAIAREAGALTQHHFERRLLLEVGVKGRADFVSRADEESEDLIRRSLFALYPDFSYTGEETESATGKDPDYRWLVDPIDGTTNFSPWHPYFRVDCFPCQETSRRASKNVGMLFDQPIPHQLVMFLILNTLAVRTRCHDYRNRNFRLWSIDVRPDYKSIVHRNGNVTFESPIVSAGSRSNLTSLGTTTYATITKTELSCHPFSVAARSPP